MRTMLKSGDAVVRAEEIQWTLEPQPRTETASLLALDAEEMFAYAVDLQRECRAVRALAHTALATVADLTAQLDRSRQTVIRLHEALRERRRAA